jgi:molybdenum ABC transporter molybdate-binding protein
MRAAVISLAAIAGLVLLLAWNTRSATTGAAHQPLSVLCAPALKPPVEALARAYEEETGVSVQLEYGGSQVILARAASGAAGDLFLPADDDYVRMAQERGLVAETFPLARMRPVLAVAAGNPKRIGGLADLTRDGIRVALANPDTAAVGRLVRDRLGRAGAWERLAARAVVFKPTVGEVANDLRLGTADAAFVWDSTVAQTPGLEEVKVPELVGTEALVAVAVLRSSRQPEVARAFARYLTDPGRGGAEFRRRGYRTP